MVEKQTKEKILELAANLDRDLELKNINRLITYFSEDCEIEILGINLIGKEGLKKWLHWFFNLCKTISFEPIVIIVEDNVFFEELNSRKHENHVSISADGNAFYLSSNRRGSKGGFDIFYSVKTKSG